MLKGVGKAMAAGASRTAGAGPAPWPRAAIPPPAAAAAAITPNTTHFRFQFPAWLGATLDFDAMGALEECGALAILFSAMYWVETMPARASSLATVMRI